MERLRGYFELVDRQKRVVRHVEMEKVCKIMVGRIIIDTLEGMEWKQTNSPRHYEPNSVIQPFSVINGFNGYIHIKTPMTESKKLPAPLQAGIRDNRPSPLNV